MQMKFNALCLLVALSFVRCAPVTDSVPMPHNETKSLNESSTANATHHRVERSKRFKDGLLANFPIVVQQKYIGSAAGSTSLGCTVDEVRENPYDFTENFLDGVHKKQTLCSYRVKCVEDTDNPGFTYWGAEKKKEEPSVCETLLGGTCSLLFQEQIMEKTVHLGSDKFQKSEHVWDFGERLFVKKTVPTGFYCNYNWTNVFESYKNKITSEKPINPKFLPVKVGEALARL